ncbi:hypothetical protein Syun_022099 [Stephania yunnanensis]|uniref:EamA domain-containing protein n=1 Tax=Stephania yunnanensis TaxID=152371 RepID=A0AAP0IH77_9MAGN
MASPSTWRWSWRSSITTLTTTTDSSSITLSIFPTPSILSFSTTKRPKRTPATPYIANLSIEHNSSSSNVNKSDLKSNPPTQIGKSVGEGELVVGLPNLGRRRSDWRRELFGKRPLWSRIFFASKKVRSIILLNIITVVYASDIPVVKEVEAVMDPSAFTVVRFALSAIPFLPFVFQARNDVKTRNAGVELGFWVSLGYLMQALGLLTSDADVILVPLLDGMLGATIPTRTWFGALVSVIGVTMLESSGSPPSVGDLLNFLSAVFFGVHMLRTEHISRSTKKENFLALLGYEVTVVAIMSATWYFIEGWVVGTHGWDPGSWTWKMVWDWMIEFPWIPALYTGAFSTGFCLWVEMSAMLDISATETAIIYGLEPVWGASFAWFLLGERWGLTGWIGAALVLGGSLTVQIFGSSPTDNTKEESTQKADQLLVSDKRKGLSATPVPVHSGKNVTDILGKK